MSLWAVTMNLYPGRCQTPSCLTPFLQTKDDFAANTRVLTLWSFDVAGRRLWTVSTEVGYLTRSSRASLVSQSHASIVAAFKNSQEDHLRL